MLRAAFEGDVRAAEDETWQYTGDPVAFTQNEFYCAKVGMEIPERFRVGNITVRATFSPADGEDWDHELQVKLYHAPPGNGPSLVPLAGPDSDEPAWERQEGEWLSSGFNFEGSESNSWEWQLRVCDVGSSGEDRDVVSGYVDSFEIEFHAPE